MIGSRPFRMTVLGCVAATVSLASPVRADSAEERFYRAYYLEQTERQWEAAAKLYEEVIGDRRADDETRAKAAERLALCLEELAASDFRKLMPPDAWAYVELGSPGQQIGKLLSKLGLIAKPGDLVEEGKRRIAVSPMLIREVLGLGGAAAAITGIDPAKGEPRGVVVFHPGDVDVILGLVETGLPAAADRVESIGGYPTYSIEGEAFVTLTSRLVIASTERDEILGVVKRLQGKSKKSLADNEVCAEVIGGDRDALLQFFVNAKAMMPMLTGMLAAEAERDREAAVALALLDLDSLNSLTGRLAVDDDGISLRIALHLDEGHHNLVYNLLRTPAIDRRAFEGIPDGVAAFVVGALNEAESRYSSGSTRGSDGEPVVTLLDIGREIFANITSFAVFALPPDEDVKRSGPPIPDVAAVIRVNDPAKSQAMWNQILGLASFATGAPAMKGEDVEIAGLKASKYRLPEGIGIYLATAKDRVMIGSTERAISSAVGAERKGRSVLKDKAYSAGLERVSADTTKAVFMHAGRCAKIARGFMSEQERAEITPFLSALSDTVASLVVDHSESVLRFSLGVTGIPDIGDLVAELVTEEMRQEKEQAQLTEATRSGDWSAALGIVEEQLEKRPDNAKAVRSKFKILALGKEDREGAIAYAMSVLKSGRFGATELNGFAWALLTEKQFGGSFAELALALSERSNEMTDYDNWMFLDTLALAKFESGDAESAVELETKALEKCGDCWGAKDVKKALSRFQEGTTAKKMAGSSP